MFHRLCRNKVDYTVDRILFQIKINKYSMSKILSAIDTPFLWIQDDMNLVELRLI